MTNQVSEKKQYWRDMTALVRHALGHPVLKRMTVYGFSTGAGQFLLMVYAIVVARFLGPENYGLFAGSYSLVGLLVFLVNMGMDTWILREAGIHQKPRVLIGNVLQAKLLVGILWALALIIFVPTFYPALFPRTLLIICCLDVLADSFLTTIISGLNIEKQTKKASWLLLFCRMGRLLGALGLIAIAARQPALFAGARWSVTLLALVVGLILFKPALFKESFFPSSLLFKESLAYGATELLSLIYGQADVTILNFLSGKLAVGQYAPALSLVNALFAIPTSVFFIVVPVLSKTYQEQRHRFDRVSGQTAAVFIALGLALSILVASVVSPLLTILLGEKYAASGQLVLILSPILLFKSISFACATYIVVVGWQAKRAWVQIVAALLNIGLNLFFIPRYGPFGAASVYLFTEIILAVGYFLLVMIHHRGEMNGQPV